MFGRVGIAEHRPHPDLAAVANFDRAGWHVVSPQVKSATADQLETRMVPMTRQDAIFDAAAVEWKAHVRTAIVESEHAPAVVHEKDWAMAAAHDEPPLRI